MSTYTQNAMIYLGTFFMISSIGLFSSESHAADEDTVRLDRYGIELTLPSDYGL